MLLFDSEKEVNKEEKLKEEETNNLRITNFIKSLKVKEEFKEKNLNVTQNIDVSTR